MFEVWIKSDTIWSPLRRSFAELEGDVVRLLTYDEKSAEMLGKAFSKGREFKIVKINPVVENGKTGLAKYQ